jgi:hypothetical protein
MCKSWQYMRRSWQYMCRSWQYMQKNWQYMQWAVHVQEVAVHVQELAVHAQELAVHAQELAVQKQWQHGAQKTHRNNGSTGTLKRRDIDGARAEDKTAAAAGIDTSHWGVLGVMMTVPIAAAAAALPAAVAAAVILLVQMYLCLTTPLVHGFTNLTTLFQSNLCRAVS